MPGKQGGGGGEGRQIPVRSDYPERRGETALPDCPAVKGRNIPARLPARLPTLSKCTSHLGFGLVQAWEAAVEGALEDGLFTLDEENALTRYINHFNLSQSQLDAHGVHTSLIKAAVLREIAEGVVPDRQQLSGNVPFNLMNSEKLVWVMDDVDYIETVVRREPRGSSHGLSIRIARGVYYRPAPSEAVQSNGRKPYTRTPACSGSPPSTSTCQDPRRRSGCAMTGSWTSSPTTTASA